MTRALGIALVLILGAVPNPPGPNAPTVMVCPWQLDRLMSGDHQMCPAWQKIIAEIRQDS